MLSSAAEVGMYISTGRLTPAASQISHELAARWSAPSPKRNAGAGLHRQAAWGDPGTTRTGLGDRDTTSSVVAPYPPLRVAVAP
jgi:hypothetical protein